MAETEFRIRETKYASGRSAWTVEFNNGRTDYAPEDRWKDLCNCESKKDAVKEIKLRRGMRIVGSVIHEVP